MCLLSVFVCDRDLWGRRSKKVIFRVNNTPMSTSNCKHCEMPLEAMWSSYAACEPGGGSVPSSAALVCAH